MLGHLARTGQGKGLVMSLLQNAATPQSVIRYFLETDDETLADYYDLGKSYYLSKGLASGIKKFAALHVAVAAEVDVSAAESLFWLGVAERLCPIQKGDWELLSNAGIPIKTLHDVIAWNLLELPPRLAISRITIPAALLEIMAVTDIRRVPSIRLVYPPWPLPPKKSVATATRTARVSIAVKKATRYPEFLKTVVSRSEAKRLIADKPPENLQDWQELLNTQSLFMRFVLCDHPRVHGLWSKKDLLYDLANLPSEAVLRHLARGADWDECVGDRLVSSGFETVIEALSENIATPPSILRKLCQTIQAWPVEPDYTRRDIVEENLANNPTTPADVLVELFYLNVELPENCTAITEDMVRNKFETANGDDDNLMAVARAPRVPSDIVQKLIEGWGCYTHSLAGNKSLTSADLDAVFSSRHHAFDPEEWICRLLAGNVNSSPSLLDRITDLAICEYLTLDESWAKKYTDCERILEAILKNPATPESALIKIAKFEVPIRSMAWDDLNATHKNTTLRVLNAIAQRKGAQPNFVHGLAWDCKISEQTSMWILDFGVDKWAKLALTRNPDAFAAVLERLMKDDDAEVQTAAKRASEKRAKQYKRM